MEAMEEKDEDQKKSNCTVEALQGGEKSGKTASIKEKALKRPRKMSVSEMDRIEVDNEDAKGDAKKQPVSSEPNDKNTEKDSRGNSMRCFDIVYVIFR
ncbi:hypothetical protein JTB14_005418 [Gonioctena quinquepunctata]|nr:hypothetical protein JTB14_005418 [Gonioctena quinquepunctata]